MLQLRRATTRHEENCYNTTKHQQIITTLYWLYTQNNFVTYSRKDNIANLKLQIPSSLSLHEHGYSASIRHNDNNFRVKLANVVHMQVLKLELQAIVLTTLRNLLSIKVNMYKIVSNTVML